MIRILITGGAGFIGSNLARYWTEHHPEDEIVVLDALTYAGNLQNLDGLGVQIRVVDVADRADVERVFSADRPEVVFHLAAQTHVDRSIFDGEDFARTNVVGTQILLDAARKFEVRKIIIAGTDEVYGDLTIGDPPHSESDPLRPSSPYAASKAAADLLALAHYRTYQLPVLVTRSTNNYGPYQHIEKLIPNTILQILQRKKVPLYGTGANVRDWIHVEDHCRALEAAFLHGRVGEIYNVGANCGRSNKVLVREILSLLNQNENQIEYVKDRPGHDFRYAVKTQKIEIETGWKPRRTLDEGLAATIAWYREHENWWRPTLSGEHRKWIEKNYEKR